MAECRFCGCSLYTDQGGGEHLDPFDCAVALKIDRDHLRAENCRLREDLLIIEEGGVYWAGNGWWQVKGHDGPFHGLQKALNAAREED